MVLACGAPATPRLGVSLTAAEGGTPTSAGGAFTGDAGVARVPAWEPGRAGSRGGPYPKPASSGRRAYSRRSPAVPSR